MRIATQAQEDRFTNMARHMSNWVEQVLHPSYHGFSPGEGWSPSVNAFENAETYCVVVDIAGCRTEDIDVQVEGEQHNMLVIRGTRKAPGMPQGEEFVAHMMEIDHGRFTRMLRLPFNVDVDQIEATYKNGFLWITMPKKQ